MGKLIFQTKQVQSLHEYAVKNKISEVFLVKDRGVYLMPATMKSAPPKKYVLYAKDCDPEKDADTWYDTSIALTGGGDDFHESLTIDELGGILARANKEKHDKFIIVLSPTSMTVATEGT